MAQPLIFIGIEAPRSPRRPLPGLEPEYSELTSDGALVERCLRVALELTDVEAVTVISGEPGQDVFDVVERYSALATDLATWMTRVAGRAGNAEANDAVVYLRADVVLRDMSVLAKALDVLRALPDIARVEPAYRPLRQPPAGTFSLERAPDKRLTPRAFVPPRGTLGMPCPAFEIHRLRRFRQSGLGAAVAGDSAFVWIDEEDFVILESPLDGLRAMMLLEESRL